MRLKSSSKADSMAQPSACNDWQDVPDGNVAVVYS